MTEFRPLACFGEYEGKIAALERMPTFGTRGSQKRTVTETRTYNPRIHRRSSAYGRRSRRNRSMRGTSQKSGHDRLIRRQPARRRYQGPQ
jgi:hypothetical protein